ncbi:MAG TPA: hypothetical protein VNA57_06480 [Acidimicrobiales bacterium]|nr:hypothetical protein [Acidimicrobiales bacterium]
MSMQRDESGFAIVTAVMVIMIVTILGLVTLRLSLHSSDTTASNRKRVQAVGAAEAGIDFALARMQKDAALPCTLADTLQTEPTISRYSATITYRDANGVVLACPAGGFLTSGTPKTAVIVSQGTTNAKAFGNRAMQALVRLDPAVGSTGFDKAIFSNSTITVANNTDVYGENGPDGDIYTNGDFVCDSGNQHYRGNIIAPAGSISFLQKCTVDGDLYARNDVKTTNNALIAHDIKSSKGNIALSGATEVRHDAIANGTNTGGIVRNNRVAGANIPDPVVQSMPTLDFDAAAWTAGGYNDQTTINDCSTGSTSPLYAAIKSIETATAPKLIRTTCKVFLTRDLKLNRNLAIFADGGFDMSNNFNLMSTASTVRDMHFIVPSSAVTTTPCVEPGIKTDTGSTFFDTVHYLMYTPCKITLKNANGGYGQIYGGTVSIENNFTFHYAPVSVFGATNTTPATTYTLDIAYKREIPSS